MPDKSQDSYFTTFGTYEEMLDYHEEQAKSSIWHRCPVNRLEVEPLDKTSPLYGSLSNFAPGITQQAVDDTAENLGLAMRVDGLCYPVRDTTKAFSIGLRLRERHLLNSAVMFWPTF